MRLAMVLSALMAVGCCGCPKPDHAIADSPRNLSKSFVFYVRNECWSESYDLLSKKTQDERSYIEWRLGAPNLKFPGTELKVRDVINKGETIDIVPYDESGKDKTQLWIFEDKIPGGPERCRLFNFLIVPDGQEWRLGLQEQQVRQIPISAE